MRYKGWRKDEKAFIRCYTIALKIWDELNANFALLYFSSYRSIKIDTFIWKNMEKSNKVVHLRLLFTYLHQNLFNIKKHLALLLKNIWPFLEGLNKDGVPNYLKGMTFRNFWPFSQNFVPAKSFKTTNLWN